MRQYSKAGVGIGNGVSLYNIIVFVLNYYVCEWESGEE